MLLLPRWFEVPSATEIITHPGLSGYYRKSSRPTANATEYACNLPTRRCLEPLANTGSNGVPPPSGGSDDVGWGELTDCCTPVVCVGAGGEREPDCTKDGTIVDERSVANVSAGVVVVAGFTVVKTTGVRLILERVVEVVAAKVVLVILLELDVVVATEGHNRSTKFPSSAWPSTEAAETSAPSHTVSSVFSIMLIPFAQAVEQMLPRVKSAVVQLGIGVS